MIKNIFFLQERHNYIAFFLTLTCNLKCSYCINLHNGVVRASQIKQKQMNADEWITAANRLALRDDLPLTLQGGEPTLHPGFFRIVNEVKPEIKMDLLTNMMFDVDAFIKYVPVWRFNRIAPYAAIRVSYHPDQNSIDDLIIKEKKMRSAGFRVGIYAIAHPDPIKRKHINDILRLAQDQGVDFRVKEFLGDYDGKLYGTFKYEKSVLNKSYKRCMCRTSELIVDSQGYVYRCHSDLYKTRRPIGHILEKTFLADSLDQFRVCEYFGDCNPCDVKVTTNRFQKFGHTSVEIKDIR